MKKYIYLSILTCILTVFGCENDFDAKIYGSLSTTNFPQSEADYGLLHPFHLDLGL